MLREQERERGFEGILDTLRERTRSAKSEGAVTPQRFELTPDSHEII